MSKKEEVKELYDKSAETYDGRYGDIQEEKYHIMLQDLKLKKPVLDLGCGTGLLGEFLKAQAERISAGHSGTRSARARKGIIGVDISLEMLKKGSGARVQGDIENLPFKDKTFPTVVSFTALQNLEDAEKMLLGVKRVLKGNGIFMLTFLNKQIYAIKIVENHFKIIEMKTCGEDIGLVLSADK